MRNHYLCRLRLRLWPCQWQGRLGVMYLISMVMAEMDAVRTLRGEDRSVANEGRAETSEGRACNVARTL
jgi:hypothetical protein